MAMCFAPKDSMYEASLRNKDTIGLLDAARAEYDRVLRDDFMQVLADYLRQAGTLKRRKNERDRRKIDMDRYKHDYQRQMEKGDHTGAMQNKRKYGGMKIGFEALNAEMIHDIPVFINDKDAFFRPVFARFILAQSDFYMRASTLYRDLLPCFQHIDRLSIHQHQHVITDEEHTSSNEPIDLTKPVDRAELQAERSAYRSVATGGAPSSTGYMSQMGRAPPDSNVIGRPLPPASVSAGQLSRGSGAPPAEAQHQQHYPPPQQQQPNYAPPQQQGGYPPPQQQGGYPPQQQQYYPPQQQQPPQPGYYPPPQQPMSMAPPPQTAPSPAKTGPKKMAKKMPKGPGAEGGAGADGGGAGGGGGGPGPKKGPKKGAKGVKKAVPPGPGAGGAMPPQGGGMPQAKALFPFTGQDATELTFQAGEVITLLRCEAGQDWWEGELRGVRGLLPSNYVQRL